MLSLPDHETGCVIDDPERLQALTDYQILDTGYDAAFDNIIKLAALVCNTPIAVINFVDGSRQWFKAEQGLGVRETPLDISICRHAILEQDLMVINDTLDDPRTANNPLVNTSGKSLRFYAGALLKSGPHALGTLCVLDYQPRTLDEHQLKALKLLREQVMHLLELRRHHMNQRRLIKELDEARNELQRQAHIDPLTGLLNRRAIENRLSFELEAPLDSQAPGAVLMLDLNDFKAINDQHGHLCGDQVLKKTSTVIRATLRTNDIIGRWGGDEFLVVLPSTTMEQAWEVSLRIVQTLEENKLADLACGRVGVSIGVVTMDRFHTLKALLSAADAAMYKAKRTTDSPWRIAVATGHDNGPGPTR